MAFAPVRSSPEGWRDKAYRWFTRKPLSPAHLVFTEDPRFPVVERDEWLAPPEVPLEAGATVRETVDAESLTITTSRVGHPLLVKVSYHPRWKAEGADGPYLVSPALMMVVPRQPVVRLVYSSRTLSDFVGAALTVGALLLGAWTLWRGRAPLPAAAGAPVPATMDACDLPAATRRWGGVVPAAVLVGLFASRFAAGDRAAAASSVAPVLRDKAIHAQAAGHFADAAEYAREGAARSQGAARGEFLCLRGASLLRDGRPGEAQQAFRAAAGLGPPCVAPSRGR